MLLGEPDEIVAMIDADAQERERRHVLWFAACQLDQVGR